LNRVRCGVVEFFFSRPFSTMQGARMIAVFVLLGLVCSAAAQGLSWDFFVLAQQWPGGYQTSTWPACTSTWTLHGLWPTRNDTTWPKDCSTTPFNVAKLGNLKAQMDCQWPSMSGSAETFWAHEWTTHGTCASTDTATSTEYSFFGAALHMLQAAEITTILTNAGITPSYDTDYQIGNIRSAIKSALGVTPIAGCTSHRIITIQLCVSKSLEFFECPAAFLSDDNCGSSSTTVWYNPIKH